MAACNLKPEQAKDLPVSINVWYGDHQSFGFTGLPQKWINILGDIKSEEGIREAFYSLNQGAPVQLTLGSDLHRLAADGDFNIDISVEDCNSGENIVEIVAIDSSGNRVSRVVDIEVQMGKQWPLPYSIQWSKVSNLQEVAQVVDGFWEITENGVRNVDSYYDRMIAFGDESWVNYEVSTTVIFHDFTPPVDGPPTYEVSHAAIASRWPGHGFDGLQPNRQWYPLGATSEFRLTTELDSCRWRIFDGPKPGSIDFYVEQPVEAYRSIELNRKYGMKHRVESIAADSTRYSVKLWPFDQPEPEEWDFYGIEQEENLASGSVTLIAHNTNVTFGDVLVTPIEDK
ncbi:MAG: hypothetical protein DHS20C17_18150 [Cyclobacteriaceae bacterium]|nr:MAG: hypothetical protein DHS20C17_18150 [Cyclobacteriaceae bacterium]